MWNLDDKEKYEELFSFEIDKIYTYGDGEQDKQKKENIRKKVTEAGINQVPENKKNKSYAFRISIYIDPNRSHELDIDNTVKLIVDSFSHNSENPDCWLYKDDCYPNVKVIEVGAAKEVDSKDDEKMVVEIFECL
jgi:Holliday junction resolvase RusA-like endonuclease